MKIHKISIGNFRCFEDLALNFHPDFNVIIGNNASGKTALLEAAAVALGGWIDGIGGLDSRPFNAKQDVRRVSHWYNAEFTSEPQQGTEVAVQGEFSNDGGVWTRVLNKAGKTVAAGWPVYENADNASRRVRMGEALTLPLVAYYGSGRLAGDPPRRKTTRTSLGQLDLSRLEGYRDAITGGLVSPRMLKLWLEYQDRIAYSERHESPLYTAVRGAITAMIPGARQTRYDPKSEEVILVFDNEIAHGFPHLSDGQRGLAALAGDVAVRMSRLNPHLGDLVLLETPGVVLIDELDLHLHPQWQRHVVADLRKTFPKVQFITTTHSPQIIGEVEPECVRILTLNNAGQIETQIPEQAFGMDSNFVLRNVMNAPDRDPLINDKTAEVFQFIQRGKLTEADAEIDELKQTLHGTSEELQRASSTIQRMRLMGR